MHHSEKALLPTIHTSKVALFLSLKLFVTIHSVFKELPGYNIKSSTSMQRPQKSQYKTKINSQGLINYRLISSSSSPDLNVILSSLFPKALGFAIFCNVLEISGLAVVVARLLSPPSD